MARKKLNPTPWRLKGDSILDANGENVLVYFDYEGYWIDEELLPRIVKAVNAYALRKTSRRRNAKG